MNKYEIFVLQTRERIIQEGNTPIDAFKHYNSSVELVSVKDKAVAKVCIKLINGKRNTENYYAYKTKQYTNKNKTEEELKRHISKCKLLGTCVVLDYKGKDCTDTSSYIFKTGANSYVLYIPSNAAGVNRQALNKFISNRQEEINLKIIGGGNISDYKGLLEVESRPISKPHINILDLTELDTHNALYMNSMFIKLNANTIIGLNNLNTQKVTRMDYMFHQCCIKELNLNMKTTLVTDMHRMFRWSIIQKLVIDLPFVTDNVIDVSEMFAESRIDYLHITNLTLKQIAKFYAMFGSLVAKELQIDTFDIAFPPRSNMNIFAKAQIDNLKMSNLSVHTGTGDIAGFYLFSESEIKHLHIANCNIN